MVDLNGTQAAIRAGYSPKTAVVIGTQNLTKLSVQHELSRLMEKRVAKTGVTAERVVLELARIAFFDIRKLYGANGNLLEPTELDDDTARAVSSIKLSTSIGDDGETIRNTEIKTNDKVKALALLAKHTGVVMDGKINIENQCGQVVFVMSEKGRR